MSMFASEFGPSRRKLARRRRCFACKPFDSGLAFRSRSNQHFPERSLHIRRSPNEPEEVMTKPAHHRTPKSLSFVLATTAALAVLAPGAPAISAPLLPIDLASQQVNDSSDVVNVAVVVRRGVGVGPRGNAYRYRSTTVVRPGYGGWARPGHYRWGPGGARAGRAAPRVGGAPGG